MIHGIAWCTNRSMTMTRFTTKIGLQALHAKRDLPWRRLPEWFQLHCMFLVLYLNLLCSAKRTQLRHDFYTTKGTLPSSPSWKYNFLITSSVLEAQWKHCIVKSNGFILYILTRGTSSRWTSALDTGAGTSDNIFCTVSAFSDATSPDTCHKTF